MIFTKFFHEEINSWMGGGQCKVFKVVEIPAGLQLLKSHGDYNSHSSPNCDIHQMFHLVQKQTYTLVKVSMMKFKVLIEL